MGHEQLGSRPKPLLQASATASAVSTVLEENLRANTMHLLDRGEYVSCQSVSQVPTDQSLARTKAWAYDCSALSWPARDCAEPAAWGTGAPGIQEIRTGIAYSGASRSGAPVHS